MALCNVCSQSAKIVWVKPVWSAGHEEPTRWFVDVECGRCGVQPGWWEAL
ncbi:DUF7160 family protein [Mycobacterium sp. URHB0021]